MEPARHTFEMTPVPETIVFVDFQQTGVGGVQSWGARPYDEYTLHPEVYDFVFTMMPVGEDSRFPVSSKTSTKACSGRLPPMNLLCVWTVLPCTQAKILTLWARAGETFRKIIKARTVRHPPAKRLTWQDPRCEVGLNLGVVFIMKSPGSAFAGVLFSRKPHRIP